jgi:hypothetical protein
MSDALDDRLRRAASSYASPDEQARARARDAFLEAAAGSTRPGTAERTRRFRFGPRLAAVGLAFAACVGGAFGAGFGVGSSGTSTSTSTATIPIAANSAAGPGFLPAAGWNVVQTGATVPPLAPTAMAANVPFAASDAALDRPPADTIHSLGPNGVLLHATFVRSDDTSGQGQYPARALPLRLSDARQGSLEGFPTAGETLRLGAHAAGYEIDVLIVFGTANPSGPVRAAAQEELARLVVPGCPAHTTSLSRSDRDAAASFLLGWLRTHYVGASVDFDGASARPYLVGVDTAPHAAAVRAQCGAAARGRIVEVDVTLSKSAQATTGPHPLAYFVVRDGRGWDVWREA